MIPIEKEDLIVMMEAGYIYLGMGRFAEAEEVFEGVSVLAPKSEVPLVALGSVFFAQGKFDRAVQHYKKAIHLTPESAFAHAYMGEALFFQGNKKEALTFLKKGTVLDAGGKTGYFAQTLLDAIQKGFKPTLKAGARS
ncbi:MAG: tetratricopeptide repeat protein [bacterium]|nr:tetratricopeptide repeat protein [bacterium]